MTEQTVTERRPMSLSEREMVLLRQALAKQPATLELMALDARLTNEISRRQRGA